MTAHWAKEEKATLFIGTERWPCYARSSIAPQALPLVLAEDKKARLFAVSRSLLIVLVRANFGVKELVENLISYNEGVEG